MSSYKNRSRNKFVLAVVLVSFAVCLSCGNNYNYYGTPTPSATSGYKHRIMVTNAFAGDITIINAANDMVYGRPIGTSRGAEYLAESHDGTFTLSYSNTTDTLFYIDDTIEDVSGNTVALTGDVESLGILTGNTVAVTASRNAPVNGQPDGVVFLVNLISRGIEATIPIPLVRRVVVNHAGTVVFAFADNTNTAYMIDIIHNTAVPVADPYGVLDHPVTAVFSSDDSQAFILSCGAECGGTQAKVTAVNPTSGLLGNTVNVAGATAGILDSSGNLYVAGSTNGVGTLQTVSASALASGTATPSTPIGITDGYHSQMAFTDNNRLYVGATNCTNIEDSQGNGVQGCLAIYNISSQAVVKAGANGDVTGILPLIGRNLAYVVQGGALVIYNTTTDAPRTPATSQIDFVGQAFGILQIS